MSTTRESLRERRPLVTGGKTVRDVTSDVCAPAERWGSKGFWAGFSVSQTALFLYLGVWILVQTIGIKLVGINNRMDWGSFIVNFVFWVGIGHAGTLISAILFLFRQNWRTSINRAAEAMTVFAVSCAGVFPMLHTGRPWLAILFVFPYPNFRGPLWTNFRSPLEWDVFAVSTYATVSVLFWYMGMIPDLATLRDRARHPVRKFFYGLFSMGWRGSMRHWVHYETAYMIFAALATPLVLSVHTIVSFDFAVSILPGWHTTIFPPYFVAGAIFSGFAMVVTLLIPARKLFHLEDYITIDHLETMNKIILLTGSLVGFSYITEFFIAVYSGAPFEKFAFVNRAFGPFWWAYWIMMSCNLITPQFFWFKKIRRSIPLMFTLSIFVNIGMWFERYVIVVTLTRAFIMPQWGTYVMTFWDVVILIGSFGQFMTLFLLFCRVLPVCNMAEIKAFHPDTLRQIRESHDHE